MREWFFSAFIISFLNSLLWSLCLQYNSPLNSRNNNQSGDRNDNFPSPLITPAWCILAVHRALRDTDHSFTCALQDSCSLALASFLTCLCLPSGSFWKTFTTPCSLCTRIFPQPGILAVGAQLSVTAPYWTTSTALLSQIPSQTPSLHSGQVPISSLPSFSGFWRQGFSV